MSGPAIDPTTRELPGPGIYRGVPDAHYHGWKGAASSGELRVLAEKTPAHVAAVRRSSGEPSDVQLFGSMVHDRVFRRSVFEQLYIPRPPGHPNSNAYKTECARIISQNPFGRIVPGRWFDRSKRIEEALRAHPLANAALFDVSGSEVSLVAHDEEHDVLKRARIDAYDTEVGLADLKVAHDVGEDAVRRKVSDFRYDLQAAFYLDVAEAAELDTLPDFVFVFVEDDDPYDVRVYQVGGRLLDAAAAELETLLPVWAECHKRDAWPGSTVQLHELPIPYKLRAAVEYGPRGV